MLYLFFFVSITHLYKDVFIFLCFIKRPIDLILFDLVIRSDKKNKMIIKILVARITEDHRNHSNIMLIIRSKGAEIWLEVRTLSCRCHLQGSWLKRRPCKTSYWDKGYEFSSIRKKPVETYFSKLTTLIRCWWILLVDVKNK